MLQGNFIYILHLYSIGRHLSGMEKNLANKHRFCRVTMDELHSHDSIRDRSPPVFMLKDLTVRALEKEEYARAGELLKQEHYR
jgi:hypothetical protein